MTRIEENEERDFSRLTKVALEGIELTSAILMLNGGQAKKFVEEWKVSSVEDTTKRLASLALECFHSVLNFAEDSK